MVTTFLLDKTIFVDSSAIYAVLNNKDLNHKKAQEIFKHAQNRKYSLVLTNFVIAETHALLLNRTRRIDVALHFLNKVAYSKTFKIIRPNITQEAFALRELNKYRDKEWSFTDMLSFVVMEQNNILYYFSFDRDFTQTEKFVDIVTLL